MEAFSLLKYWRGGASNASANARSSPTSGCTTTTIVTAATTHLEVDTDDEDDGPFFDLQFTVPDEDETEENQDNDEEDDEEEECEDSNDEEVDTNSNGGYSDGEKEFNFTVPIEPNSSLDSKTPQFTVSLLKSAAKVRVFLLKLKKSKLNSTEKTESTTANATVITPKKTETKKESGNSNNKYNKNKFFTVKFKVEEVPIMSLFSKDNSKSNKQQSSDNSVSDVMQRYLNKVKPLYVKASRRYGDKLRFSDQSSLGSFATSMVAQESVSGKNLNRVNVPAGLGVVRKQFGNNRSASSAVAPAVGLSKRRDDSLLQQEDGVQSAILHCKRSFNGSRDSSVSSMSSSSDE